MKKNLLYLLFILTVLGLNIPVQTLAQGGCPPYDPCTGMPGCSTGPAIEVFVPFVPDTVMVNGVFNVQVGAVDTAGKVDTTYSGSVSVSVLTGPGNLSGTLTANFNKGQACFDSLILDALGSYQLLFAAGLLMSDTTTNIYADTTMGGGGGGGGCPPSSSAGERTNLGLYGGSSIDLTFCNTNKRLFAAISSPASLFATDDTCKTWYRAFPEDSLEYECGLRGWGGRATRVLANNVGWVAVQTTQEAGILTSSVISYSGGDTNTWKTAMDGELLSTYMGGIGPGSVTGIGLSDYFMYSLLGQYITRVHDTAPLNPTTDIIDVKSSISGLSPTAQVSANSIAVANDSSGYPIYIVVDTTNSFNSPGLLYKYTGSGMFTAVNLPMGVNMVTSVFTHPNQMSGDTIFVTADSMGTMTFYRSFDGGTTWTDVSYPMGGMWAVSDVDYSSDWVSLMPSSNGVRIAIPGLAVSDDLGSSWKPFQLQNNGGATYPTDTALVVGTMGRGVVVSTSGVSGSYAIADNYGLEAVVIKKMSQSSGKTIFYAATKGGLAYTTEFKNASIAAFDKWNAPYGEFPVANVGDDAGVFSVAVDPNDSTHVVAGYSNGFSLTTTGPTGFVNVMPPGYNSVDDPRPNDILFVTSSIVLAVTGGDNQSSSGKGNIWRSTDGGANWTKVSPLGFNSGNALAMGTNGSSNVIYAGTGLSGYDAGALWKSTDDGLTWTLENTGPIGQQAGTLDMPIYDLAVDPRGTDTLYIASGSNLDYAFVRSTDGGSTYNYINAMGEGAFSSVAVNQQYPDTVYVAIRRDILVYDAVSDTTFLTYRGLPGELVPDLMSGSIIAGTSTGMYNITLQALNPPTAIGTSVKQQKVSLQNYPNPFRGTTTIKYQISQTAKVTLKVMDMLGREVATLVNTEQQPSIYEVQFNGSKLDGGVYYCRLVVNDAVINSKMLLIK